MNKQDKMESILREYLGEAVHTAFRKGSDHESAHRVWKAIRDMPAGEWGEVISWLAWALAIQLKGELQVVAKKAAG